MGGAAKAWVQNLETTLLPVPYFHLVFTLPRQVSDVALYNKSAVYGLLMRVSAEVLTTIASDRKLLGGNPGFISVLHTWSQTLEHHPHVHIVAPGGVLTPASRWRASKKNFFVPVRVLSALFRRRFLEELTRLRAAGKLKFLGRVAGLVDDGVWKTLMATARSKPWVVYAKRPFGGPKQVLRYLARYTHRVAISNKRLRSFDGERVAFGVRASSSTGQKTQLSLPLKDFVNRFLLHVLPKGFVRIRYYGYLNHSRRTQNLALIRKQLGVSAPSIVESTDDAPKCPSCGSESLARRELSLPVVARESKLPIAKTGPPQLTRQQALLPLAA